MSFSPCVRVMTEGEKNGGASSKGLAESAPLVGIALTDLPSIRGTSGPPLPPHPLTPIPALLRETAEKLD